MRTLIGWFAMGAMLAAYVVVQVVLLFGIHQYAIAFAIDGGVFASVLFTQLFEWTMDY